jgi:hypothetical protein
LFADDQRADTIGALGNSAIKTPNLADRPEHAARVRARTALLEKEQKRLGDTAPLAVPNPKPAGWTPPKQGQPARGSQEKEQP